MIILPNLRDFAPENMALDWFLLEKLEKNDQIKIRHYQWRTPSLTFGYGQAFNWVQSQVSSPHVEICRRPTGGGVVDHQNDWTYSLIIPAHKPPYTMRPLTLYNQVHSAIASALNQEGIDTHLMPCCNNIHNEKERICFQQPSPYDVILKATNLKIAGAALKKTRQGLLIQGSINTTHLGSIDLNLFKHTFFNQLGLFFNEENQQCDWADVDFQKVKTIANEYRSPKWNERR